MTAPLTNLPTSAGTSFKPQHFQAITTDRDGPCRAVGFFEVHSENYFNPIGTDNKTANHRQLAQLAQDYPLSFHGVGMNLGSATGLDPSHLAQLKALIDHYQPAAVSDHIAWVGTKDHYLNDLLPLPYTEEALNQLTANVIEAQDRLDRRLLIENPSTYLTFTHSHIGEADFVIEAARQSGAGLLLDINNVYVNGCNHGFDPAAWLNKIPADLVGEIHLAGHAVKDIDGVELRIDDHGSIVPMAVWSLYADLIGRIGPRPTLIEWDTDVPDWAVLQDEARKAARLMGEQQLMGRSHA